MAFTLITGASSGIGEEFARQYAKKGHSLILIARSEDKLQKIAVQLKEQHHIQVHVIAQDLSQVNSAEQLFAACQNLGVEVNFLINNAGFGLIGDFDQQDLQQTQDAIILNTLTLTKLVYLFLPQLKKTKGCLINVASQAGFAPTPYMASYAATKAYVLNFTEAIRVELSDTGIKIMALCPGPTYTSFFKKINRSPNDIRFKFRTPAEVVSTAISAIESNKSFVIPGWENKLLIFMTRLSPRPLVAKMSQFFVKNPH